MYLQNVTLNEGQRLLYQGCFARCSSLQSITIPASIVGIEDSAFYECSSLKTVYCKASVPPDIGAEVFLDCAENMILYVPIQSVDAYVNSR